MEYNEIKKLIEDMGNSKLTAIDIEFPEGMKIKMEKQSEVEQTVKEKKVTTIVSQEEERQTEEGEGNYITSPMVGTFYAKPSPKENAFVEIGSKVKKGDTLCIIEAMKLMNEIEAEQDGEVVEILVKDGEMVDFGRKLFRIQ